MKRPKLLDLFCGGGGCAAGYTQAGFHVTGIDHLPQKHYLLSGARRFIQADALEYLAQHGKEFDAVHASPPCQGYSRLAKVPWIKIRFDLHPRMLPEVRAALEALGKPWVIENVEDAPLNGFVLCGRMFGLQVYRHRRFECSFLLMIPSHPKHCKVIGSGNMLNDRGFRKRPHFGIPQIIPKRTSDLGFGSTAMVGVYGHAFRTEQARVAMECPWMNRDELRQAIPPAYCRYLGKQLKERC